MHSTKTMEKTLKNEHLSKWKLICTESKSCCKLVLFLPKFGLESQGLKPKKQKNIFPNRILNNHGKTKKPSFQSQTKDSVWKDGFLCFWFQALTCVTLRTFVFSFRMLAKWNDCPSAQWCTYGLIAAQTACQTYRTLKILKPLSS